MYTLTAPVQPNDQLDWNKLPGISDCDQLDLSVDGVMFGWRWRLDTSPKVLEITAYATTRARTSKPLRRWSRSTPLISRATRRFITDCDRRRALPIFDRRNDARSRHLCDLDPRTRMHDHGRQRARIAVERGLLFRRNLDRAADDHRSRLRATFLDHSPCK